MYYRVASSSSSRLRHGPWRSTSSALYRPFTVSASALSYESRRSRTTTPERPLLVGPDTTTFDLYGAVADVLRLIDCALALAIVSDQASPPDVARQPQTSASRLNAGRQDQARTSAAIRSAERKVIPPRLRPRTQVGRGRLGHRALGREAQGRDRLDSK